MAIAPHDPRHPDLTASDVLSPQTWPKRGIRPATGLDVICTKIAVDFQSMTAVTALEVIAANLELLREATRTDAAFHIPLDAESGLFNEIQVARGMLATCNPEQLRGQSLESFPWLLFFFQAEDGIRDVAVTGVQTCALPIYAAVLRDEVDTLVGGVITGD